jgi:hypothetical protein
LTLTLCGWDKMCHGELEAANGLRVEKRKRIRAFLLGLVGVLCLSLLARIPVAAQDDQSGPEVRDWGTLGIFLGQTSSRQLWSGPVASDGLSGWSGGVFIDAQTPLPFLSVRAEAGYAGRGGVVWDEDQDPERRSEATVRSHYLSVPVHGKVGIGVGPLLGYLFAGPTVDFLLASQCSKEFCQTVREEKGAVVNVAIGGGVGAELPGGLLLSLEVRHTEGLSDAYQGTPGSARNRSREVLVRVGRPS